MTGERALDRRVARRRDGVAGFALVADADIADKMARHYETKREPPTRRTAHGLYPVLVVSRY